MEKVQRMTATVRRRESGRRRRAGSSESVMMRGRAGLGETEVGI
jgi:hypothetical protein